MIIIIIIIITTTLKINLYGRQKKASVGKNHYTTIQTTANETFTSNPIVPSK